MLLFGKLNELTNGKKQRPIPDEICTVATNKVSLLSGCGTLRPRSNRKSSFLLLKTRTGRRSLGVPRYDDSKSDRPCPEEELVKLLTSVKKKSKATELILYEKKNIPPVPEPPSFLLKKRTGRRSLGVLRDDDSKSERPCPEEELVKLLTSVKKKSKATELILYEEKNGPPVPEPPSFWSSPIAFQLYLVIVIAILSGEPASFFQGMSIIMMLQSLKVLFQWAKFVRCSTPKVQKLFLRSSSC
jgi:hypothetical protein